ncbi:isochorismatase [Xylariomycetidae sp. FL2044]|nr:isochorismatase [Xylariomycetidae sp. FL2044]
MTPKLTFGPDGDQWKYDKETRNWDLTRGVSSPPLRISTTHGAPDTSITLAPALTALVVIDMQNFFLDPKCNDHPAGLVAVDRTLEVIKKCREAGIRIIWLNWGLNQNDITSMPAASQRSFASSLITPPADGRQSRYGFGSDMGDGRGRLLVAGEWNARLYDALQSECRLGEDIFCDKNRISGFWDRDTPFAQALRRNGLKTLLFAGVNTDQCVFGTLADAYYHGFDCVLLDDCCATKTPNGQEVTVWNTSRGYGFVTDSKSFCA